MTDSASSPPGGVQEHVQVVNNIVRGFMQSEILFAANNAGVFSHLEVPRSAEDIAETVGWDARATRILLDGLVALKLIEKSNGLYRNTPSASACLVPGGAAYQGHIIRHLEHVARRWARLEEPMRTGVGVDVDKNDRPPEELRAFILGMSDIARLSAREVLNAIDLSSYRHFLDIGGGPATYPITFLKAHPGMRATVFDLPPVIEIGREQVREAGIEDRVSFLPGDITKDAYGSGYDLVLISNIIHSFGPADNLAMIRKCHDAMTPGGLLIVKDFVVENDRSGPPYGLIFAINMLVGTREGDTYTYAEIAEWTRAAGFGEGRIVDLTPQSRMWLVNKPV